MEELKCCCNCKFNKCTEEIGYYCSKRDEFFGYDRYYDPNKCEAFEEIKPEKKITKKSVLKTLAFLVVLLALLFLL